MCIRDRYIAICEGQPVMIRRNRVLCHICRLFPVVDLKDISEDLAALDGFRDNDAGNALVVGLDVYKRQAYGRSDGGNL